MGSHQHALAQLMREFQGSTALFLEAIEREVDIGVHAHEIGSPQRIRFDLYVMMGGANEPTRDEIGQVLDYEYLLAALDSVLDENRSALLETLATRLLDVIMEPESVEAATVVITKLDVLKGDGRLGCSMTRVR